MKKFYFTFGSAKQYPYGRGEYIVVEGISKIDCLDGFRKKYPDVTQGVLNCSDYYEETYWKINVEPFYYAGDEPKEVIVTYAAEHAFDDVYVYVMNKNQILRIAEGTGDNLLKEDIAAGYVDYIIYEQYDLDQGMPEFDGGQLMYEMPLREKYNRLVDSIPDVLEMAYEDRTIDSVMLNAWRKNNQ